MKNEILEIKKFKENHFNEVSELQKYLWGRNKSYRSNHLKWKYLDNPFTNNIYGVVATHQTRVVGFRGLIPLNWEYNNNNLVIACYADAVVNPDYRGNKLLQRMNEKLFDLFKDDFSFVVALSSNEAASHIYKKQGSAAIGTFEYMRKVYWQIPFRVKKRYQIYTLHDLPKIKKLIDKSSKNFKKYSFRLKNSIEFYKWKLTEPGKRIEIIGTISDEPAVSMILEIKNKSVEVLEFGFEGNLGDVFSLLRNYCIRNNKTYATYPQFNNCNNNLKNEFRKHGFRTFNWISKVKPSFVIKREVLIQPFSDSIQAKDWLFNDINIRQPDALEIRHMFYV